MTDFVLTKFESEFTMGLSGEIYSQAVAPLDVSATAVLHVTLQQMKDTFKFQTDASNVDDISASDLKYYVYKSAFPTLNPSLAKMNDTLSVNPILTKGSDNVNYATGVMRVEDDYVRYLALRLFNTAYGVDLFSNVDELISDLSDKGETAWDDIVAIMTAVDATDGSHNSIATDASGVKYMTETNTTHDNLTRELMKQMLVSNKSRFVNIAAGGDLIQSLPFAVNDTISFKLTINAAPSQHLLTGLGSAIPARSYGVKIVIDADV